MARRRMIDPNIWQSEDFSRLSTFARLVFIGLFSQADDEGRGRGKPTYIKSTLFPYDDGIRVIDIEKALSEIAQHVSVTFYDHDGSKYYSLDNWAEWQTIEKPKPSKIPAPPSKNTNPRSVGDESPTNPRSVGDESRLNRNRREDEKEREEKRGSPARFVPPTAPEVEAYCAEHGYAVNAQQFVDFYASKGWKVGNQPMKDWRAAVRTWVQRRKDEASAKRRGMAKAHNHHQRAYTETELAGIGVDLLDEVEPCAPADFVAGEPKR